MQRADLSRLYAEHGLTPVKSTKLDLPPKPQKKSRKIKRAVIEFAPKRAIKGYTPPPPQALPKPKKAKKPTLAKRDTKIKTHTPTAYEALQLENKKLRDQLFMEKHEHYHFLNQLRLMFSLVGTSDDYQFIKGQIISELKKAK